MTPNAEALQQWANSVLKSDYWQFTLDTTRMMLVQELLKQQSLSDTKKVQHIANKLLVLDDVSSTMVSLAVDVNFKRKFHEVLEDDAD